MGAGAETSVPPVVARSRDLGLWNPYSPAAHSSATRHRWPAGSSAASTRRGQDGPQGSRRTTSDFPPIDKEKGYDLVDQPGAPARAKGSAFPRLALSWVLGQRGTTSVIIGAKRPEQLEDNLLAVDVAWSDGELAELATLTAPPRLYPNWMQANFASS